MENKNVETAQWEVSSRLDEVVPRPDYPRLDEVVPRP